MGEIAVVIGATGVVGREIISQLSELENIDKVLALTRKPIIYKNEKIINHVIDFTRLEDVESLFCADLMFSALGTTLKQAGSIEAQRVVDIDYQFKCAQLAKANGVKQYLLVSSSGANSSSNSAYLKMKGELETKIKELSFEQTVIVQPSLLLGERTDVRIGEVIGRKVLPMFCKIPVLSKYRPIRGSEVAKALILFSQKKQMGVQTYSLDELFIK